MELDLGTAISGGIIFIVCMLPFILMYMKRKKNEKQFLQLLSTIAEQQNCQISQYDVFGMFGIGLDEVKNVVFFYRKTNDNINEYTVDLSGIKSCEVINTGVMDNKQRVVDSLELSFIPVAKNNSIVKMVFFNSKTNIQLCGELQLIEKWSTIINNQLKKDKL
jgi:hypothetical protein